MAPAECHETGRTVQYGRAPTVHPTVHTFDLWAAPQDNPRSQPEEPTTHLGHLRSDGLRRLLELGPYDTAQFLMSILKVPGGPPCSAGTARTRTYTLNFRTMPSHFGTQLASQCSGSMEQLTSVFGGDTGLEWLHQNRSELMESPSAH
jgi:hypothetical protein